jgi:hypothetical protein
MLKLTIAFFLVSAVPYCSKCVDNGDSCADTFAFNIVDATSGNNLVFGSNPIYNQDSVYLTTTIPGYSGKMSHSLNGKFESALLIPVDTFFLRLSPNDTDTLIMKYDFVKANVVQMTAMAECLKFSLTAQRSGRRETFTYCGSNTGPLTAEYCNIMKVRPKIVLILLTFSCVWDPPQKGKELIIHNQTDKAIMVFDSLQGSY